MSPGDKPPSRESIAPGTVVATTTPLCVRTIGSIAARVDQLQPRPALRFALVAYRDHGDEYVTRVYDFTPELATFQKLLSSVRADGGGDEPEALNEGLHAAVEQLSWEQEALRLTPRSA